MADSTSVGVYVASMRDRVIVLNAMIEPLAQEREQLLAMIRAADESSPAIMGGKRLADEAVVELSGAGRPLLVRELLQRLLDRGVTPSGVNLLAVLNQCLYARRAARGDVRKPGRLTWEYAGEETESSEH